MIIKGKARARSAQLAAHLLRTDQNERVEVREYRGVIAQDLYGALEEIEAHALASRSTKPFYHAAISPRADQPMTKEQWAVAIDTLEAELGFTGQPRIVVVHHKAGREHAHVVWSRIDLEKGRAIHDSWNYVRHEQVARQLERAFGHERVQGAFAERERQERPQRTPGWDELRQAERSGITPQEVKAELTAIWHSTDTSKAFLKTVERAGYILARGDRRTFVVVDPAGHVHALARRIDGVRTKDVKDRLASIDLDKLPSVGDARTEMKERLERLKSRPALDQTFPSANLDPRLAASLYDQGGYVQMTQDAQRHMRHKADARPEKRATVADRYYATQMQAWQLERPSIASDRSDGRDPGRDR